MTKRLLIFIVLAFISPIDAQAFLVFDSAFVDNPNIWRNTSESKLDQNIEFRLINVELVNSNLLNNRRVLRFDSNSSAILNKTLEAIEDPTKQSISIELWFKPTALVGNQVLFEAGGGGNGISLTQDNSLIHFVAKTNETSNIVSTELNSTLFHQVVAVVDLETKILKLFLDGYKVDEVQFSGNDWAGSGDTKLATKATPGSATGGTGGVLGTLNELSTFQGEITLLRIYYGALGELDIGQIYSETVKNLLE